MDMMRIGLVVMMMAVMVMIAGCGDGEPSSSETGGGLIGGPDSALPDSGTGTPDTDIDDMDTAQADTTNTDTADTDTPETTDDDTAPSSSACAPTEQLCAEACVNLSQDINHCGGCNLACDTNEQCIDSICQCEALRVLDVSPHPHTVGISVLPTFAVQLSCDIDTSQLGNRHVQLRGQFSGLNTARVTATAPDTLTVEAINPFWEGEEVTLLVRDLETATGVVLEPWQMQVHTEVEAKTPTFTLA
ncbi:MAG: hypothetical protein AAFX99_25670, partial [Myxococcota bacterium]